MIGGSMLLFIMSDVLTNLGGVIAGGDRTVGEIEGEEVDYLDFSNQLQGMVNYYQQQGYPTNDGFRQTMSEQLWNDRVNQTLLAKELEGLGIRASSQEIFDLIRSENPPQQFLNDQYIRQLYLNQETGRVDLQQVEAFLAQAATDENVRQVVAYLEATAEQLIIQQKYFNALQAGVFVPTPGARRQTQGFYNTKDIEFVAITFGSVPDSTVQLTDSDYRNYYQKHREQYRIDKKQVEYRYVPFYVRPSAKDSQRVFEEATRIKPLFEETEQKADSLFAYSRSDVKRGANWQPLGALPDWQQTALANAEEGTVVGPILTNGNYVLTKLSNTREDSMYHYSLRHILITAQGPTPADSNAAKAKADSIASIATADNWETLVATHSNDESSRFRQGDLGWIDNRQFGKAFTDALAGLPVGQISRQVVKGPGGYHVVEVRARTKEIVFAPVVTLEVYASSETITITGRRAQQFAAKVESMNGDFDAAAREEGLDVVTSPSLQPGNSQIPGLSGTGQLVTWLFTHERGDFSGVQEVTDAYVVGYLSKANEPGYLPLEDVLTEMEAEVRNEKKASMIIERLNGATGSLEEIKAAYGEGAFSSQAAGIAYQSNIPGIGPDNRVLGTIAGLDEGEQSKPIRGSNGVYIVRVTKVSPGEVTTEALEEQRARLQSNLQQEYGNRIFEGLRLSADVKDKRYRFGL